MGVFARNGVGCNYGVGVMFWGEFGVGVFGRKGVGCIGRYIVWVYNGVGRIGGGCMGGGTEGTPMMSCRLVGSSAHGKQPYMV